MDIWRFKEYEKEIFGENMKLTKIQQLFVAAQALSAFSYVEQTRKVEQISDFDISSIFNELEAEIDKEFPLPDSSDFNRFIAMKAIAIFFQSTVRPECGFRALSLLEPIKDTPEGAHPYIQTLLHIARMEDDAKKSLEYYWKAEAAFDNIKANKFRILSYFEIFGGNEIGGSTLLDNDYDSIMMEIFMRNFQLRDDAMKLKYVLPALKATLNKHEIIHEFGTENALFEHTVILLRPIINCLIDTNHFEQVDHVLSILMFHLVKMRRDMPKVIATEIQAKIDASKAIVSFFYAIWAYELLVIAAKMYSEKHLKIKIRTEMIRLEKFMEPGIEIYEKQFPVNVISDEKEWDKVVTKGKLWCQRAVDYFEKAKTAPADYLKGSDGSLNLLKRFDERLTTKPEFLN
ncbi:uncharacterized protein LOC134831425 [Culicoides brevitarsis]|uniref:uncharacterized protein LOC134831425 n=1 Tax=Culicoides brevitarsis TaxID=469753 RepID=UPI00307B9E7E